MIIKGQTKHPASDGTYHDSWFAAFRRTMAHMLFMSTYDGRPEMCGYSWDKETGKPIDHHKVREMMDIFDREDECRRELEKGEHNRFPYPG